MAKRHPSLIPLSRDHHDGLMLAMRLRQGKRALLQEWSHDPSWQAKYVVRFSNDHLVPHFEAEEKVLFPVMKEHVKESLETVKTLLDQHEEMRRRVRKFENPERKSLEESLKDFGVLLEGHIRIEENELFPAFERSVPKEVAKEVGKGIERIENRQQ